MVKFRVIAKCVLTIQGSGKMDAFADNSVVPWKPVNSMITKIVIGADVRSLSAYAFHHLINLQSVYNYGKGQTISGDASKLFEQLNSVKMAGNSFQMLLRAAIVSFRQKSKWMSIMLVYMRAKWMDTW